MLCPTVVVLGPCDPPVRSRAALKCTPKRCAHSARFQNDTWTSHRQNRFAYLAFDDPFASIRADEKPVHAPESGFPVQDGGKEGPRTVLMPSLEACLEPCISDPPEEILGLLFTSSTQDRLTHAYVKSQNIHQEKGWLVKCKHGKQKRGRHMFHVQLR